MNLLAVASLLLVLANFVDFSCARRPRNSNVTATFTNPIFDGDSADPAMIKIGDYYYLGFTAPDWNEIVIYQSPVMTDFRNRPSKKVYSADPSEFVHVWAPEFHIIDGDLFIYFTQAGAAAVDHHLYVLKAEDPNNPMGNWTGPFLYVFIRHYSSHLPTTNNIVK